MTAARSGRLDHVDVAVVRACADLEKISALATVISGYACMDPDTATIGEAVEAIAVWSSRASDELAKVLRP